MPDAEATATGALVPVAIALGLGVTSAVGMVAGHQPWDGPQVASITETHGLHVGDLLAVLPLAAGAWLARWCAQR